MAAIFGRASVLLATGIVLIAANLRPPVTSVSALLSQIRLDLGLSSTAAALLTAAPVLCFALLAPFAPRIADRLGMERTLGLVLTVVAAGLLVRIGPNPLTLFGGTILVGGAIALGNVLLPALIKRDFPTRTGALTGAYVTSLTVAASIAAGVSVPIAASFDGWRAGLGVWAILALLTLVVWTPQLRTRTPPPAEASPGSIRTLLRDRLAWQVTAFFGLQSLEFYAIVSWLPTIYRDAGFSAVDAGYLLSFATIIGAPAALIVPSLAVRAQDQRLHVAVVGLTTAAGLAGLLVAPTALPWLWAGLIGLGVGASFPLVLTLLVLRTRSSFETARLSAMAQSIGYLIAAAGPFTVGALHDVTGGWSASVALLLVLMAVLTAFGLGAARRRYVLS